MKSRQLDYHEHQATQRKFPVCLLAHDFGTPMNVGSLFRIADALGIEKIYLSGTTPVPPNTKIRRTSRAAEKYIPYFYEADPLVVIQKLKSVGYKIVSLEITSTSIDIRELSFSPDDKVCLILGSEKVGIIQALLDVSDITIYIPMLGQNSSMNVATACAIATYEITRRHFHERQTGI